MIYFIQDQTANLIKIGYTGGDATDRMSALQTGSPIGLVLLLTIQGERPVETELHRRFASARAHGEWFRPVPELVAFMLQARAEQAKQAAAPKGDIPWPRWPLNIYLAGKVSRRCWRHSIVDGLDSAIEGPLTNARHDSPVLEEGMLDWPVMPAAIFGEHNYVGPYFFSRTHRGCFHGDDEHGVSASSALLDGCPPHSCYESARAEIVATCLAAMDRADLVFAWIDSPDCYGTIAEIGFAMRSGKRVWIAGPRRYRDLWFVYELSELIGPPPDGVNGFTDAVSPEKVLRENLPQLKDYKSGVVYAANYTALPANLEIGWIVRHPSYGVGRVEEFMGDGVTSRVRIHFSRYGSKMFVPSKAALEIVSRNS